MDALVAATPAFVAATIPAGLYRGTPRAVATFGVGATLVTRADEPEERIDTIVRSVFDDLEMLRGLDPALVSLDPAAMARDGLAAPLHPAAESYYRERGWLDWQAPRFQPLARIRAEKGFDKPAPRGKAGPPSPGAGNRPARERGDQGRRAKGRSPAMYLGIDIGTSSVKTVLFDRDQKLVGQASQGAERQPPASRLVRAGSRGLVAGRRGDDRRRWRASTGSPGCAASGSRGRCTGRSASTMTTGCCGRRSCGTTAAAMAECAEIEAAFPRAREVSSPTSAPSPAIGWPA